MLFNDILNTKTNNIQPEFDKLFNDILKNQTHDGDLLLIKVNGFYNPEVHSWLNLKEKLCPYMIGPNMEGHSDNLHYEFIHNYRTSAISQYTHPDYLKLLKWDPVRTQDIDKLTNIEALTIQLEMLVYLKIWEADFFIKKLYQLTRLSQGENYDWHFSIAESNRVKNATGTRNIVIRTLIRDRLKDNYPQIYSAIKNAYKSQIRNSIAHSQYSFLGRNIHPNNYIKNEIASQIIFLSFDEWIDMFHDTMIIYNQIIRLFHKVDSIYANFAFENNLLKEVRIKRTDPENKTEYHLLKYIPELADWRWNSNEK